MSTDVISSSNVSAGFVSGFIAKIATSPIERCVILKQLDTKEYRGQSLRATLAGIYRHEGVRGLFKCNGANALKTGLYISIEFTTFEYLKKSLRRWDYENRLTKWAAGAVSSLQATCVTYPLDVVKTLLAKNVAKKSGFDDVILHYKVYGINGFYRSLVMTGLGMALYSSLKLTFYESTKEILFGVIGAHKATYLLAGALASVMAVTISYPTDMVRRNYQVHASHKQTQLAYLSFIRTLWVQGGLAIFYRGLGATYAKLIPSTALTFMLYESFKHTS